MMQQVFELRTKGCKGGAQMFRKSLWLIGIVMACKGPSQKIPDSPVSLAGRVTAVQKSGERTGSVNVEARSVHAVGSNRVVVRVTDSTTVIGAPPDHDKSDFNGLQTGQWVRVWFVGPVRQSYPMQANAGTIVIDSTASYP
jgi:hypothetical protein